jgi:hypothetical protein
MLSQGTHYFEPLWSPTSRIPIPIWPCLVPQAVCTPSGLDDFCYALQQEWMRICSSATEVDVQRAKNQLRAALSFSNDGSTATCDELGL